jgi:hypothetical protein
MGPDEISSGPGTTLIETFPCATPAFGFSWSAPALGGSPQSRTTARAGASRQAWLLERWRAIIGHPRLSWVRRQQKTGLSSVDSAGFATRSTRRISDPGLRASSFSASEHPQFNSRLNVRQHFFHLLRKTAETRLVVMASPRRLAPQLLPEQAPHTSREPSRRLGPRSSICSAGCCRRGRT